MEGGRASAQQALKMVVVDPIRNLPGFSGEKTELVDNLCIQICYDQQNSRYSLGCTRQVLF